MPHVGRAAETNMIALNDARVFELANSPQANSVYLAARERIYEGLRMAGVPEAQCPQRESYSITSSARKRISVGIVRPSSLAVFRFTTSSKVVSRSIICSIAGTDLLASSRTGESASRTMRPSERCAGLHWEERLDYLPVPIAAPSEPL
jgi:hypothetical protein